MAITIDFLANVAGFLHGTKNAEDALDAVSDALDDVVRDSAQDADKIGDGFDDTARDVDNSTERMERSFKDLADTVKRETRDLGKGLDRDVNDGVRGAKRGLDDFKQESSSTARESAASFDGSAESIGDAFQEVAANAFSGFGPAGAVAGLAAAAGIGLVSSALVTAAEDADALKSRIASAYQAAVEEGRNYLDEAQIIKATSDIMFGDDQGLYQQAQRDAAELGITTIEVVQALAGDQDALNVVLTRTNELEAERNQRLTDSKSPMDTRAELMTSEGQALQEINDRYTLQQAIQQGNIDKANEVLRLERENIGKVRQRNDELGRTPAVVKTTLEIDDSAIDRALRTPRTFNVEIAGYSRAGNRVF